MKNIWLRDIEKSPSKRPKDLPSIQPLSFGESYVIRPKSQGTTCKHDCNWQAPFRGVNDPSSLKVVNTERLIASTSRIANTASKDPRYNGGPGYPGGHIARALGRKSSAGNLSRSSTKPFNFSEQYLSFGRYDVDSRPRWDQRFNHHQRDLAKEAEAERRSKRVEEKTLSVSDKAIVAIIRDVINMYTTRFVLPRSLQQAIAVPLHLNADEAHVWLRIRLTLHNCGQLITQKNIEQIQALCNHSSEGMTNPLIVHLLRYLHHLLGGGASYKTAKHILTKNTSYLLRLLQEV